LNAELLQNRLIAGVELDPVDQLRLNPIYELDYARIFDLIVDPYRAVLVRQLVPQYSLDQVEIAVYQRRRLNSLGLLANIRPGANEVTHVVM
jgi:hypothetical protein